MPSSVRPHGAPGSLPGPHSTYQPASRSTNGSSQRPVPKNGHRRVAPPVGEAPLPRQQQRDQRHGAETQQEHAHQRPDDGRRQPQDSLGEGRPPPEVRARLRDAVVDRVVRRAGVDRGVERRGFATG